VVNYSKRKYCKRLNQLGGTLCYLRSFSVIQTVDATCDDPSAPSVGSLKLREAEIVARLLSLLHSSDVREKEQYLDAIDNVIHSEIHSKVDMVAAATGHSIRCYFFCQSPAAVLNIHIANENGRMRTVLATVFRLLLGKHGNIDVFRTSYNSTISELRQCMAELRKDLGK
jgi:hypothetical protein